MSSSNPESNFNRFIELVENLCEKWVPKKTCGLRKCNKFYRKRKILWRKRKKLIKQLPHLFGEPKRKLESKIKQIEIDIIKSYQDEAEHNERIAINKIKSNSSYFYRYAKKFSSSNGKIEVLVGSDGVEYSDPQEISNILSDQYESVFSIPDLNKVVKNNNSFFSDCGVSTKGLRNVQITDKDIEKAISTLSSTASAGPDGLPAIFLKNCKASIIQPLKLLFNESIQNSYIHDSLKQAAIVPIHKGGDRSVPSNYRPVSLTPHLGKLMERILKYHIVEYLETEKLMNNTQHGFREGRSCVSALLDSFDLILTNNISSPEWGTDAVYLDFSRAFDKVDHGILLHKIRELNITDKIGTWIAEFLSNRKQFVRFQGHTSKISDVKSSVPQGTVAGPILFLILMLDIDLGVESPITSFADDTRVFREIQSEQDKEVLQRDLNKIYDWSKTNNMKFNGNKFKYINFNCSGIETQRRYMGPEMNSIDLYESVNDLGVTLSANCEFKDHITNTVNKCSQLSGWILRTFKTRDKITMITLYKSLVLPRLDYCSQLWSPTKTGDILRIEKVQRQFTRNIENLKDHSYPDRLRILKLYSLERRRERYIVIYLWKILENIVPNLTNSIDVTNSNRRGRLCVVKQAPAGKAGSLLYNSFRYKAVRLFNCLPREVRDKTRCSVDSFKSVLDTFLTKLEDTPGRPEGQNSLMKAVDEWRWTLRVGLAE